ncbi:MAG: Tryptophan--tRNA ligase [Alphaproteobacteria bacterium MarineAlpha5_Bin5]|nr:MAG: Tryptophan--tRNA ligase [Alphaproteobacteria bacterium MarineAlpha5_Bin5]PPR52434.1 MAG: Tryptophan--tRNA ligase [Alphaproteobacteria bacterium MarineAlpha5_Bin4]|tara:strand:- start:1244 stop:2269 length:1026 start_codon:yes stop_codon:yes gene_type:complete
MEKPTNRILSGVQPSGDLHLGNYLGAIKNFVSLQHKYECFFCVVDLHAITVWQDPATLAQKTREVTAAFIASGIDPKKNTLFVQSQVPQHAQLAWMFSCIARMGWLNRMTQFKDKAGKNSENVSVGLFSYPTLMAADILIYLATHVPVGEDQKQHLELTRDIAQKFNNDFKHELFPIPEPLILGEAKRVMSLRDGTKKMSKSDPSDYSRIMLTDSKENIVQKIKKAKTDPLPLPDSLEDAKARPEALNLLTIFAALNDSDTEEVISNYGGKEFSQFKNDLGELASSKLSPISDEVNKLMSDKVYLDSIIVSGKEKAISVAKPVLDKVFEILGFLHNNIPKN